MGLSHQGTRRNAATDALQHRSVDVGPQTVTFNSGRSDSTTVKPERLLEIDSTAAREPAVPALAYLSRALPAGTHYLQCY